MQAELYANPFKIRKQFKSIKTIFWNISHKRLVDLKPWYLVHVDLVLPYSNSIRQQKLVGATINNNISLACMMIFDPATGWF